MFVTLHLQQRQTKVNVYIIVNYIFALAHNYFLKDKPLGIEKSFFRNDLYGIRIQDLWYDTEPSALDVQHTIRSATGN